MSKRETISATGRWLCGEVEITAKSLDTHIGACHCGMCRHWSGGPLLAAESHGDVELSGKKFITVFESSEWAERGFCSKCGTHLFYRLKQGNSYFLPAGLFDLDEDFVFDQQIFIDKKPTYYHFANKTKNMTGEEVFAQAGVDKL